MVTAINVSRHLSNTLIRCVFAVLCLAYVSASNANEVFTVAYSDSYKPFAWQEQGQPKGIQVDFINAILVEHLGYKVVHFSCPWMRCQKLAEQGAVDAFVTVPTPDRSTYAIQTSTSFYQTSVQMHTAKSNPYLAKLLQVQSLEDIQSLTNLRHVFMRGSGWHLNELKAMNNITQVHDAALIPLMLVQRRADLYIEQTELFRFQARQLGLLNDIVTIAKPVIDQANWYLFISKASPRIEQIGEINRQLEALRDSNELNQLRRVIFAKYGIE